VGGGALVSAEVGDMVTFAPHPDRQPHWFVKDIRGKVALLELKSGSSTDLHPRRMRHLVDGLVVVSHARAEARS